MFAPVDDAWSRFFYDFNIDKDVHVFLPIKVEYHLESPILRSHGPKFKITTRTAK